MTYYEIIDDVNDELEPVYSTSKVNPALSNHASAVNGLLNGGNVVVVVVGAIVVVVVVAIQVVAVLVQFILKLPVLIWSLSTHIDPLAPPAKKNC
jgi:hypothetical protein